MSRATLGERIELEEDVGNVKTPSAGSMEMTFTLKQSDRVIKARQEAIVHHEDRRKIRRSAGNLRSSSRGRGRGRNF